MNNLFIWIFDLSLAVGLFWVSWQMLTTSVIHQITGLFMVFSGLMALSWIRLSALPVALLALLLGMGVTGLLIWYTIQDINEPSE